MWKPWKINNDYTMPEKPVKVEDQVSAIWEFLHNHLPSHLHAQDKRIIWQDRKMNFLLIMLMILIACWGKTALS